MTNKLSIGLLLCALADAALAQGFGPAVTVGEVDIPRDKVLAQVEHLVNQRGLGSGGITQPSTYRLIQEEVVEQVIVQELLWQEAQRRNVIVDDQEVDLELAALKSQFDSDLSFQFKIKEGGFTEATFRENIRQQRSVQRMITDQIIPTIEISSTDIETFYDENIGKMQVPEQVRARHILIRLDPNADAEAREQARGKILAVQKLVKDGASFAILATEHSEDGTANQGGDLGFFERGKMVEPFDTAAFALAPGAVSDVVETQFGLHLIKVEERVEPRTLALDEVAPQIRDYLGQQALESRIESMIDNLRTANNVQIHLW